jgi:protein-disulfide isomerase
MVTSSRTLVGLALGMSLTAFVYQAGAEENGAAIVAEVAGQKLARADLERAQAAKLLQARYQYYLAEREALDRLIDEHLLAMEARRQQVGVNELLHREVISGVTDPTEDQLQVFYEGLQTDEPFTAARAKIVATLRQLRLTKARAAYLQSLRRQADVRVALAPPRADVALENAATRGPRDAHVLVVEFADYECSYCQRIHPDLKKLQAEFPGKVAVAFKDFPLPMHSHAKKAAEAARCAGAQGRFWEYHDVLFENQPALDVRHLIAYADELDLDVERFADELTRDVHSRRVHEDFRGGILSGVNGTPTFFVNGVRYDGDRDAASLLRALRAAMS